ncbi:helix-turn-helix transcriptional regulator [Frigidibacter sp. ROC022]|uniref:helix-turn-helix transcriptional regulator n=1 Tax=Frigidibacter sp. ROC022 TaxID=2971796 RepID=UPI00215B096B|nr:response regulator transcription factor [Frigidibacter sp. ROC022]MCR8725869.1 response regulator transcription factor [Frigidibacter sp. ROC022]
MGGQWSGLDGAGQLAGFEGCATVMLMGSRFRFSDRFLRVTNAEFEGVRFLRVGSLDELSALARVEEFDLVVFECARPDDLALRLDGFLAAAGSAQIALTYPDDRSAQRMAHFLLKQRKLRQIGLWPAEAGLETWWALVRLLLAGRTYHPSCIFDVLQNGAQDQSAALEEGLGAGLTVREIEVLHQLSKGASNKLIARDLDISEHTVKLHVHHIMRKVEVCNRTEAANWYMQLQR